MLKQMQQLLLISIVVTIIAQTTGPQPNSKKKNDRRESVEYVPNDVDPLHLAVEKNDLETVKKLLSDPTINPNIVTEDGRTPLIRASFEGHAKIVEILLQDERIVAIQTDDHGYNALHCSTWKGWDIIVQTILSDGRIDPRDTTAKNSTGKSKPNVRAGKRSNTKSMMAQFDTGDQSSQKLAFSPLMIAANNGNDRVLRVLIKDGRVDINKLTGQGDHLILLAAKNGHAKGKIQTIKKQRIQKHHRIFKIVIELTSD